MPAEDACLDITVQHRGATYEIRISSAASLLDLQQEVYALTRVQPAHQKLLAPLASQRMAQAIRSGKAESTMLQDLGLHTPLRLTVIGAISTEVEQMQRHEAQAQRLHQPRSLHPSLLRDAKPRSTATPQTLVFGRCEVHPSTWPSSDVYAHVLRYLERLASDPAILSLCRSHGYRVGVLTELLPHEHPELLGLNENRGQRILLRVRTDAADGMRDYATTRRVLLHELAHNEVRGFADQIDGHPPAFKILNSQLNQEVLAWEQAQARGTHVLS
ncbi:hypothetical protein MNAN1_003286 [Malassezia nana]|uniref:WLM domain-containing protein n=1 Tax=Malassezia nana TaxID=180528 RepID=A0AAF0EPI2_9BASI|nr:hypothetical protein MNAN1_003286 [Malassezia nana]